MNIAAIVLDILILSVVALVIVRSSKRGFMQSLIGFFGCFAVLILSVVFSWIVSDFAYGSIVRPRIVSGIEDSIGVDSQGQTASQVIDGAIDSMPKFVIQMAQSRGLIDNLQSQDKTEEIRLGVSSAASVITDTVAKPVVTGLIQVISMIILFIIGMFGVKIISRVLNKLVSGKYLGSMNSFFGGLLGIPKGLIYAIIITWIVGFSVFVSKNGIFGITVQIIEETYVFKIINLFNPLLK